MKQLFTKSLLSTALLCAAGGASAAAFQLAEVSTSGLGTAYAGGAAVADNASVVANNPALMTKFNRPTFSVGGIVVDADVDVSGSFYGKNVSQKNVIPTSLVPNAYVVYPVNDKVALGAGMNVNYGLKSEFAENFDAGVYGGKTELKAINLNLSGAYKLGYGFSFGLGFNAVYADAEVTRHLGLGGKAIAQGLASNPRLASLPQSSQILLANVANQLRNMPAETRVSSIKGDAWGYGWNAGLSYELNENHRWGIAYRSAVNIKFKGEYANDFPTQYNALLGGLSAAGVNLPITQATGGEYVPGRLTLHLPASWEFSGYHRVTDKLAFQYSYKLTEWKRFKSLDAYGERGNTLFSKEENYSNSSRYAVGFSYDLNEKITLRSGLAYDRNASRKTPSISIPDTDRTWYSLGATYRFSPDLSVDVGYAHLQGKKQHFVEGTSGKVVFDTKAKANLYGLNLNYSF